MKDSSGRRFLSSKTLRSLITSAMMSRRACSSNCATVSDAPFEPSTNQRASVCIATVSDPQFSWIVFSAATRWRLLSAARTAEERVAADVASVMSIADRRRKGSSSDLSSVRTEKRRTVYVCVMQSAFIARRVLHLRHEQQAELKS